MSISHYQEWRPTCHRSREDVAQTQPGTWAPFEIEIVPPCGKATEHFGMVMAESSSGCCSLSLINTLESWWKDAVFTGGCVSSPSQPLGLFCVNHADIIQSISQALHLIIMLLSDCWVHRQSEHSSLNLIKTPALVFSPFLLSAPYKSQ